MDSEKVQKPFPGILNESTTAGEAPPRMARLNAILTENGYPYGEGGPMMKVLFLCVHNSARSQMAEAFLKKHGGPSFQAESAGLESGRLNPYVVRAMAEVGIDISANATKSVFDLAASGARFDYVITVCSKEAAERCPFFPGPAVKAHWPFDDPSTFTGSDAEIMARVREVRDAIAAAVREFAAGTRT